MLLGKKPSCSNDPIAALSIGSVHHQPLPPSDPVPASGNNSFQNSCRNTCSASSRTSIKFDLGPGNGATSTPAPKVTTSLSGSSFAQRNSLPPILSHKSSDHTSLSVSERDKMMRNIDRPPPGDPMSRRKTQVHPEIQKKRSTYFEAEFAASNRDPDPVRCRVQNEALVLAEFKTNVIVSRTWSAAPRNDHIVLIPIVDQG